MRFGFLSINCVKVDATSKWFSSIHIWWIRFLVRYIVKAKVILQYYCVIGYMKYNYFVNQQNGNDSGVNSHKQLITALINVDLFTEVWASYQIHKITGYACVGKCRERFPRHGLQRKPICIYPSMGITNPRWLGKRSRHSRCLRNPQCCVSGQRPKEAPPSLNESINLLRATYMYCVKNRLAKIGHICYCVQTRFDHGCLLANMNATNVFTEQHRAYLAMMVLWKFIWFTCYVWM